MQGKRKARPLLTGWNASYLDALNNEEKNQKKNRTQDNITCRTPSNHAKPLVNGFFAALGVNIRVRCLQKLAIESDRRNILVNGLCSALHHLRRAVHHCNYICSNCVVHCFKLFNEPLVFPIFIYSFFEIRHFFRSSNLDCIHNA
uniref:Uncharacterized protein n=1 Tax=Siphoviridae sp. ctNxi14 TaxID=2825475 RepID=A0A8S5VHE7_9CAUD|nr:MAG TPA: hypothetical protein [Siphoviridae sp. ctNxi14]